MATDTFFSAGVAHFFRGRCLNIQQMSADPASSRQSFSHCLDMGCQSWCLTDDGNVCIAKAEGIFFCMFNDLLEQENGVDSGKACIGVGKVVADILCPEGSKDRITECMRNDVGI